MTKFEETLLTIDTFLAEHRMRYAVIGGFAVIAHGMQRLTQDIDITVAIDNQQVRHLGEIILRYYKPRKESPIEFLERHLVLPTFDPRTGVPVDFSAGIGGFDQRVVDRARPFEIHGKTIQLCTFEDLIIYKLAANRLQDQADTKFLLSLNKKIDLTYLRKTAAGFVDLERSDILESVNRLFPEK